jgi:hypothetical protein
MIVLEAGQQGRPEVTATDQAPAPLLATLVYVALLLMKACCCPIRLDIGPGEPREGASASRLANIHRATMGETVLSVNIVGTGNE